MQIGYGPRVVSFAKDSSASLVTPPTEVAAQRQQRSHYKSLLGDIIVLTTSRCSATLAMKGLNINAFKNRLDKTMCKCLAYIYVAFSSLTKR